MKSFRRWEQTCWNKPWWKGRVVPPGFCLPARTATSNCSGEICISSIKLPSMKSTYTASRITHGYSHYACPDLITIRISFRCNKCNYQMFILLVHLPVFVIIIILLFIWVENYHENSWVRRYLDYGFKRMIQMDVWIDTYSRIFLQWMFAAVHSKLDHAESKSTNRKPTHCYPRPFHF